MKKILLLLPVLLLLVGCSFNNTKSKNKTNLHNTSLKYGVFLSIDNEEMNKLEGFDEVVIDAQYFEKEDIDLLHSKGKIVYSYINLGSLENFRDYYDTYKSLIIKDYENWEEEGWVDVSNTRWINFMKSLAKNLISKGIDGFFVDNTDVYYFVKETRIFNAVTTILKDFMSYDKEVIINGGDEYILEYSKKNDVRDVATAINQETVFSKIDFKNNRLLTQSKEDREYYQSYIEEAYSKGLHIYLLEYTTDSLLIERIKEYSSNNHFNYYISDSIELD